MSELIPQQPAEAGIYQHISEQAARLRTNIGRIAASGLLMMSGVTAVFVGHETLNPESASAATVYNPITGDYPDANAPCHPPSVVRNPDGTTRCVGYDWRVPTRNSSGAITGWPEWTTRGYGARNCTDYVAWRIGAEFNKDSRGLGHATTWNNNAGGKGWSVDRTPEVGDIAQFEGNDANPSRGYGHVAFVEKVNPDGTVRIAEYNQGMNGAFGHRTMARSAVTNFIDVNGINPAGFSLKYTEDGMGAGAPSSPPLVAGTDTVGVYNSNIGTFDLRNSNTSGNHDVTLSYGNLGVVPLKGDWDGDGDDTIGVYNPNLATFDLRNSNTSGTHDITLSYGNAGAVPLVGDWNGDGVDTIGVYNPNLATFDLRNSNTSGTHDITLAYGNAGSVPLVGDWNGDGIDTVGVYNPNIATFDLRNTNTSGTHDITLAYGNVGSKPVIGDWNGDGVDTIGVYNPKLGTFDLRNTNTSGTHDITLTYGNIGIKPLVGDWNGS